MKPAMPLKFEAQVLVFFLFWAMVVYVFALILRQLTEGDSVGFQYFSNVPHSVNNLLLYGIIPDQRDLVDAATTVGAWMWPLIVCFFFFVSITIMYMLVGVLVDVMWVTSQTEKLVINIFDLRALLLHWVVIEILEMKAV